MAELLCKAISATNPNPDKDQRGCYKLGMIVEIRPDGFVYGTAEGLPTFFKIKIPLVPVDHPILQRLMQSQQIQDGFEEDGTTPRYTITRRRTCWLRHVNIPQAAKDRLRNDGELIIKANPSYEGSFDYSWSQIKNYLWDDDAQADMTNEL